MRRFGCTSTRIGLPGRSTHHALQPRHARPAKLAPCSVRRPRRPGDLDDQHRQILALLRRHRYRLWRTWELKEQLRDLYRTTDPADARAYLKRWCTAAKRSRIPAFANLVRRIEKHADAIVAAVELGLSNSRLEGINAKIRLIQRRGFGFRNLDALTAAIYLCLGEASSP
jgi:transposase